MRAVAETFRHLHDPEEIASVLWAIGSGVDPFAAKRARAKNPDNLPTIGETGAIEWQHRVAALKLYAEYALGKPLQGVVVDAQVQQQIAISGEVKVGPVDVRSLPPEVRAALRLAASAALGRALPGAVIDARSSELPAPQTQLNAPAFARGQVATVVESRGAEPVRPSGSGDSELLVGPEIVHGAAGPEAATDGEGFEVDALGVAHLDLKVTGDQAGVKHERKEIALEFRESTNLVGATLGADGILSVRFRDKDGNPARSYRYANVTPAMMAAWREAPSAGAWFYRNIRANPRIQLVPERIREPGIVV